jgi:hypothetical protein
VKKKVTVIKKNTKKAKKKRTFSTKFFGRGALDEKYTEPLEPKKK